MADAILTINAGSSSLKFGVFAISGGQVRPVSHGQVEGLGSSPHFTAKDRDGSVLEDRALEGGDDALFAALLQWVDDHLGADRLRAAGHRVVHGGTRYDRPARVDDALLAGLDALTKLAPLHQPHNLAPIRAIAAARPELVQVACFDTAFHHGMPAVAARLALPRALEAEGVRRYGFHGLSYEYIAGRLRDLDPALAAGRVIVAHLGSGASLCAMRDGRSMDTTMGFSALDGLVMGTRPGTTDPGVILHLLQHHRMDAGAVEDLLYHRSGLLGVSGGIASDMRKLQASEAPEARDAVELFVFRIAREAGALASTLGGLDGLVFTAGIGEHDVAIRAAVCDRLAWLGLELDQPANAAARDARRISTPGSRVAVWMIPTDEEAVIARHTLSVLRRGPA